MQLNNIERLIENNIKFIFEIFIVSVVTFLIAYETEEVLHVTNIP